MMTHAKRGIIDAGTRMLEELMLKTTFKDDLRAMLNNIDPENSPRLVRAILEKDIEVPLSVISILPAVANSLILMADELIRQVNEKFPPPLLQAFAASLMAEIDHETLARVIQRARQLAQDISPGFKEVLKTHNQGQANVSKEVRDEDSPHRPEADRHDPGTAEDPSVQGYSS